MTARPSFSQYDAMSVLLNEVTALPGGLQGVAYRMVEGMHDFVRLETLAAFQGVTDPDAAKIAGQALGRHSWKTWGQLLAVAQRVALDAGVAESKTVFKLETSGWEWLLTCPKEVFQFVPEESKIYLRASAYLYVCLFEQLSKESLEASAATFERPVEQVGELELRALGLLQFISVALNQRVEPATANAAVRAFWRLTYDLAETVLDDKEAMIDAWDSSNAQHVLETTDRWYTQAELDAHLDGEQAA